MNLYRAEISKQYSSNQVVHIAASSYAEAEAMLAKKYYFREHILTIQLIAWEWHKDKGGFLTEEDMDKEDD